MDESPERSLPADHHEAGLMALRILQVHAAHQKRARAAQDKLSAEVRAHLQRMGAPEVDESDWPALESANSIVSALPPDLQDKILSKLPEPIREQMVELLFAFTAIPRQPARATQKLIQATDKRALATALIGCDPPIYHAITANMSRRAATMLAEDIESLVKAGELSTRDVREARDEVSTVLYGLYESGELGAQADE